MPHTHQRYLNKATIDIIRMVYRDELFDDQLPISLSPLIDNYGLMAGQFLPSEQSSYTCHPSRIFNAISSGILLNQLCFVYLLESNIIDPSEGRGSTGRLLLTNISIDCRGVINHRSERDYLFTINTCRKGKRETGEVELSLSKGRFLVRSSIIIADRNLH